MKKSLTLILLTFLVISAFAQESVKWYTVEEAEKLVKQSPRPIFIDTFTDWCGWCKKMDRDTFTNPVIADILNNKFYPVKFNAEGKESVTFFGQKFINDETSGKTHQLAIALLQGNLSYPTVVFMIPQKDGKFGVSPIPGYKPPKEMEVLLSFFADKNYETSKWDEFQQSFKGKVQ